MGITDITLYNIIRKKLGEQETYELVEFIHSEAKAELDTKTNVFLIKEDKVDLIDRINKVAVEVARVKSDLIFWMAKLIVLQYILLMFTKKFF